MINHQCNQVGPMKYKRGSIYEHFGRRKSMQESPNDTDDHPR